jgi:hypothetical protein
VGDRKLKGQLKHTERLYKEANQVAARVNTWLAPADAGFLETEGTQQGCGGCVCVLCLKSPQDDPTQHAQSQQLLCMPWICIGTGKPQLPTGLDVATTFAPNPT